MPPLDQLDRGARLHGHLVEYGGDHGWYDNEDMAETLRAIGSWIGDQQAITPNELHNIFLDAANLVEAPDDRLAEDD